jgi:hypothetical protein
MAIWYIFPVLVCCTKKNLATLMKCRIVEPLRNLDWSMLENSLTKTSGARIAAQLYIVHNLSTQQQNLKEGHKFPFIFEVTNCRDVL